MDDTQFSGVTTPASGWTSDEQEIATLVEDFINSDEVPTEVIDKVERLHASGHSHRALKIILESLD